MEFELELKEGQSEVMLSTTKAQTDPLYLDNFTLTPLNTDAVDQIADGCGSRASDCHDIFGRKVDIRNLSKGQLYICNGKKYIKK